MTILIILLYIGNVFLARWFNMRVCKIEPLTPHVVIIWLMPVIGPLICFTMWVMVTEFNLPKWGNYPCHPVNGMRHVPEPIEGNQVRPQG
jgi:hypothetical protein